MRSSILKATLASSVALGCSIRCPEDRPLPCMNGLGTDCSGFVGCFKDECPRLFNSEGSEDLGPMRACDPSMNDPITKVNPLCNYAGTCLEWGNEAYCECCASDPFGEDEEELCPGYNGPHLFESGRQTWGSRRVRGGATYAEMPKCMERRNYFSAEWSYHVAPKSKATVSCQDGKPIASRGGKDVEAWMKKFLKNRGYNGNVVTTACKECSPVDRCLFEEGFFEEGISFTFATNFNTHYDASCEDPNWPIPAIPLPCDANKDAGLKALKALTSVLGTWNAPKAGVKNLMNKKLRLGISALIAPVATYTESEGILLPNPNQEPIAEECLTRDRAMAVEATQIGEGVNADAERCQEMCKGLTACQSWTLTPLNGSCKMYSVALTNDNSVERAGVISGPKDCVAAYNPVCKSTPELTMEQEPCSENSEPLLCEFGSHTCNAGLPCEKTYFGTTRIECMPSMPGQWLKLEPQIRCLPPTSSQCQVQEFQDCVKENALWDTKRLKKLSSIASAQVCHHECSRKNKCKGWSFDNSQSSCILFRRVNERRVNSRNGFVSGTTSCSPTQAGL